MGREENEKFHTPPRNWIWNLGPRAEPAHREIDMRILFVDVGRVVCEQIDVKVTLRRHIFRCSSR